MTDTLTGRRDGSFKNMLSSAMHKVTSAATAASGATLSPTAFYNKPTVKCGWLKKQGGLIKNWNRRWFVLKDDHLFYFSDETEAKLMGTIPLLGNKVQEIAFNVDDPDKFLFEIASGDERSRMTTTHETYPICAESDDERRAWIQGIRSVIYAALGGGIFGKPLELTMQFEARTFSRKVPQIIENCAVYLQGHGLQTEGIFRLPGRAALVRELREAYDCGQTPDLNPEEVDVHTVASLMKSYLRELPQPIIPFNFYENVIKVVTRDLQQDKDAAITHLCDVIITLPPHNYNLLKYICHFLKQVSEYSSVNRMNEMNLATVFVQSVIRPEDDDPALLMGTAGGRTKVVFELISEWTRVFTKDYYNDRGGATRVETLLDLAADTPPEFQAAAPPGGHTAVRVSELLDINFQPGAPPGDLAVPLAPVTSSDGDHVTPDSPPRVPVRPGERSPRRHGTVYQEPPRLVNSTGDDVTDDVISSPPPTASPRTGAVQRSATVGTRPQPKPRLSVSRRSTSCDGISTADDVTFDPVADLPATDHDLDLLLQEDLADQSEDQLRVTVRRLAGELRTQRASNRELQLLMKKMKQYVHNSAHKVDDERAATADAVERIVQLQEQLQQYRMTFGNLK